MRNASQFNGIYYHIKIALCLINIYHKHLHRVYYMQSTFLSHLHILKHSTQFEGRNINIP